LRGEKGADLGGELIWIVEKGFDVAAMEADGGAHAKAFLEAVAMIKIIAAATGAGGDWLSRHGGSLDYSARVMFGQEGD